MTSRPIRHQPTHRLLLVLLSCLLALPPLLFDLTACPLEVQAANLPAGFYEETILTATAYQTTAFVFVSDGRILIAEKAGLVRVYKNGVLLTTPLLDIRARVNQYEDRGLLGLAIDPAFATGSPYIYLAYTYEHDSATAGNARKTAHVSRFTVAGDTADPASEQIILGKVTPPSGTCNDVPNADCLPSDGTSHSVGNLKFAPDGSLFVNSGDSGDYNQVNDDTLRVQNLDSLAGKVLRINKDGTGWADNPFKTGNAADNRSKIWAYGVRNAFRFNLRPGTDLPYLGDVGWGNWEEINVVVKGSNLGWPCYEGDEQQPGYAVKQTCKDLYARGTNAVRQPLVKWPHPTGTASVTGGAFYTGTSYPEQYRGAYFYGDYSLGFLRTLRVDANNTLLSSGGPDFATNVEGAVDIETGPDGDIYYLAILTGQLVRIRYDTPPPPPLIVTGFLSDQQWATASNGFGPVERDRSNGQGGAADGTPLQIGGVRYAKGLGTYAPSVISYQLGNGCDIFSAQVGIDDEVQGVGGAVVFQVWSGETLLYDSGLLTGADPPKAITVVMTGRTELRLVVTDGGDGTASDHADWAAAQCGTNTPPIVTIDAPTAGTYRIGDLVAYAGSASDPDGGPPPTLTWQRITRHCPGGACHAHPDQLPGARGTFVVADHDDETYIELLLTATDNGGLKTTSSVRLDPQQALLNLDTSPSGLNVIYGGRLPAPKVVQQIDIGATRTITAPSPQILDGTSYRFSRWSDGNTNAQRAFTMGAAGATYTAIFEPDGTVGGETLDVRTAGTGTGMVRRVNAEGQVVLTPQSAAGSVFVGWTIDGQPAGWANPLTITLDADHRVVATFAPRQIFGDATPDVTGATEAIAQLAARGIIKGCDQAANRFCPTDLTLRAQMAALIVRTMGWGAENPTNPFNDRDGVDAELWRAIAILAAHGVAQGYADGTYGTTSPVLNIQVISFITRAMVDQGYWTMPPDVNGLYPNVAAASGHRQDVVTYVHYAGAMRGASDVAAPFAGWDAPASRAWFAFALWQAVDSYFSVDRPGSGGYVR